MVKVMGDFVKWVKESFDVKEINRKEEISVDISGIYKEVVEEDRRSLDKFLAIRKDEKKAPMWTTMAMIGGGFLVAVWALTGGSGSGGGGGGNERGNGRSG